MKNKSSSLLAVALLAASAAYTPNCGYKSRLYPIAKKNAGFKINKRNAAKKRK